MAMTGSRHGASHRPQRHVTSGQQLPARLASGYRSSAVVGLLLAVAAGAGLFVPGTYHGNTAFAAAAFRGADLVSMAVAIPALAASALFARKGSYRALLVWLGVLAYVGYTYLYAFAIDWNRLFLVYVALLSLTVFTIIRAFIIVNPEPIAQRFGERAPVRGVGLFLWLVGGMLGLMELLQIVPALVAGHVTDVVAKSGHPTGVIYILDLGLVVPLMLLAGRWIRARRPWGYVAAAILLVKAVTEGLAVLAGNLFNYLHNRQTDGPLIGLWALIALVSLAVPLRYLRCLDDVPPGGPRDREIAHQPQASGGLSAGEAVAEP